MFDSPWETFPRSVRLDDRAHLFADQPHVLNDVREPLLTLGASDRFLEALRDRLDIDFDVAGELGDLVERDRDPADDHGVVREWRRAERTGHQLDVFLAEQPQALDRGGSALPQRDVGVEVDVDERLSLDQADLADLADLHARHAHGGLLVQTSDVLELDRDLPRTAVTDADVLDLPDEQRRDRENDQEKRPDFRCRAHDPSETAVAASRSNSTVSGPSAFPSTN